MSQHSRVDCSVTYLNKTHSFTFQSEESLKLELELLNKGNIRSVNLIFVVLQKKSNVNIKVLKLISVPDSEKYQFMPSEMTKHETKAQL